MVELKNKLFYPFYLFFENYIIFLWIFKGTFYRNMGPFIKIYGRFLLKKS